MSDSPNFLTYAQTAFDPFEERSFCAVDSLVFAWLSYLDMPELTGWQGLDVRELLRAECYQDMIGDLWDPEGSRSLLEAVAASPRYRGIRVCGYRTVSDAETTEQFAAMTFRFPAGFSYLSFRGTDSTIVGWKEDFNMAFRCPVPAQESAARYVDEAADAIDGPLLCGGHSKGGNLAVYGAAMCPDVARERIERAYSHDGPGMNEQIIAYSYYQEMAGRIRKTIPGFSVIGTLLGQQEISKVIKSDGVGILQHNPFNWVVEKGEFVPLPGLNKTAELLDQKIDNWVSGMTTEEREEFVNKLFSVISEAENLNGIGENWRDEFGRIAKKLLIP